MAERFSAEKTRDELLRGLTEMFGLARTLPRRLDLLLERAEQGELTINTQGAPNDSPRVASNALANRLSLALVVVAGILGSVLLLGMDRGPYVEMGGLVSLGVTLFLSFWLVVTIFRSQ